MKSSFLYLLLVMVLSALACTEDDQYPSSFYNCFLYFQDSSLVNSSSSKYQQLLDEIKSSGVPGIQMSIQNKTDGMWLGTSGKVDLKTSTDLNSCNHTRVGSTVKTFTATTEVKVTIVSVDSKVDEPDDLSEIVGNFYKPVVESKKMTVKFTTDYYPAETSWKLTDNKSRTLASATYKEGPDQFGGGGDDANTEHVYEVSIDNTTDVNCLIITLTDAYGDGMTAFNNTVPTPGVEFYNEKGELIKPKLSTEYNFQSANPGTDASSTKSYAAFSLNTSLEDASFVENLNVYPNPVADILNIDMKIKAGTEYEVFVTNTMGAPVTTITQNTNFINVANLAAGMYFLNVKTNEGIFAHKFTKI